MSLLDDIISSFSMLPGLGKKSAARIVYHLLKSSPQYSKRLGNLLNELHDKVRYCANCGSFSEGEICEVCLDEGRDKHVVCVVEEAKDVNTFLSVPEYTGLFHVLGGAISPLNGVGPEKLNIESLIERVKKDDIKELILATNPTLEGDTTALYIQSLLKDSNVKMTRLAFGLPVGGDLEYVDRQTLARSLNGRLQF
ncbi:MAG: recombination mediator RecR [Treponema sp.]